MLRLVQTKYLRENWFRLFMTDSEKLPRFQFSDKLLQFSKALVCVRMFCITIPTYIRTHLGWDLYDMWCGHHGLSTNCGARAHQFCMRIHDLSCENEDLCFKWKCQQLTCVFFSSTLFKPLELLNFLVRPNQEIILTPVFCNSAFPGKPVVWRLRYLGVIPC